MRVAHTSGTARRFGAEYVVYSWAGVCKGAVSPAENRERYLVRNHRHTGEFDNGTRGWDMLNCPLPITLPLGCLTGVTIGPRNATNCEKWQASCIYSALMVIRAVSSETRAIPAIPRTRSSGDGSHPRHVLSSVSASQSG